ncbi:hypothetical protein [Clostridioides difficile]|uniref:hypothetical protein n=1 Tax=Clostridioides difficile TaxID=1496 RepID=UPI000D1ED3E2|nr:hypothetical protein [Clostridioides difficile]HBE9444518.1 hypothetical protein [Clostridioides difficile]
MNIKRHLVMLITIILTILSLGVVSFADPIDTDGNANNGVGGVVPKTTANAGGTYSAPSNNQDGVVEIKIPQGDQKALGEIAEKINSADKGGQEPLQAKDPEVNLTGTAFQVSEGAIKFNTKEFSQADNKSAKQNLRAFVNELKKSQVSDETQQYIFDLISQNNADASVMLIPIIIDSTRADMFTGMKIVGPFLEIFRVAAGVASIIIIVLLIASSIVDLVYIGVPIGDRDNKKPMFISPEAISAVRESVSSISSGGQFKNAYVVYLKRKVFSYIILSICLLYLIAGELGGVIGWFLNLASGLV